MDWILTGTPAPTPWNMLDEGRWATYASADGRLRATAFAMPAPADPGVKHAPGAPRVARFQVVRVASDGKVSWDMAARTNIANFDRGYDRSPGSAEDEAIVASFLAEVERAAAAGALFR